jgi:hypothetical protein
MCYDYLFDNAKKSLRSKRMSPLSQLCRNPLHLQQFLLYNLLLVCLHLLNIPINPHKTSLQKVGPLLRQIQGHHPWQLSMILRKRFEILGRYAGQDDAWGQRERAQMRVLGIQILNQALAGELGDRVRGHARHDQCPDTRGDIDNGADGVCGAGLAADEVLRHECRTEIVRGQDRCEVVPEHLCHGCCETSGACVVDQDIGGALEGLLDLGIEVLDLRFNGDIDGDADYLCRGIGGDGFTFFFDFGELVWFATSED